MCSQCVRFGRERDCEYTDKDRRSRSEILEEKIAFLQARLHELESGDGVAASMQFGRTVPSWEGESDGLGEFEELRGLCAGALSRCMLRSDG